MDEMSESFVQPEIVEPPPPVAETKTLDFIVAVDLTNPRQPEKSIRAQMMIDTGADLSVLPRQYADALGLLEGELGRMELRSAGGAVFFVFLAPVAVRLAGRQMPFMITAAVPAHPSPDEEALLGRDILKHVTLTISGPDGLVRLE